MHNAQTVDPLNSYAKAIKKVSSKRHKTDSDYEEMAKLEWEASLYLRDGKPCLPGNMIEACLKEGGKVKKLGKVIASSVWVDENPLIVFPDSDKTIEELYLIDKYRLAAKVNIQRQSIIRTRPKFDEWEVEFTLLFDDKQIDEETLTEIMEIAQMKGVGDWRPKFGRFTITKV